MRLRLIGHHPVRSTSTCFEVRVRERALSPGVRAFHDSPFVPACLYELLRLYHKGDADGSDEMGTDPKRHDPKPAPGLAFRRSDENQCTREGNRC